MLQEFSIGTAFVDKRQKLQRSSLAREAELSMNSGRDTFDRLLARGRSLEELQYLR